MAKYMLVYHGGAAPANDAEREVETAAWTGWFTSMGAATADRGNPVAQIKTSPSDGSAPMAAAPIRRRATRSCRPGRSTRRSSLAKGCPHLRGGGSVEVAEIFEIM